MSVLAGILPLFLGSDEHIYDRAMTEGAVNIQTTDSVLVGVAGSGKTHSVAMALNEPLPEKRESTLCQGTCTSHHPD